MYFDKKSLTLLEYWIYSNCVVIVSDFFLLFVIANASKYVMEVMKTKLYLFYSFIRLHVFMELCSFKLIYFLIFYKFH